MTFYCLFTYQSHGYPIAEFLESNFPQYDFIFDENIIDFSKNFLENFQKDDVYFTLEPSTPVHLGIDPNKQKKYFEKLGMDFSKCTVFKGDYVNPYMFTSKSSLLSYFFYRDVMLPRIGGHRIGLFLNRLWVKELPRDFLWPPKSHYLFWFERNFEDFCAHITSKTSNRFYIPSDLYALL